MGRETVAPVYEELLLRQGKSGYGRRQWAATQNSSNDGMCHQSDSLI